MKTTMKSIICGLVMVLGLMTCSAYTEAEYRAEYDKLFSIAQTNKSMAQSLYFKSILGRLGYDSTKKDLAKEIDDSLSSVGIRAYWIYGTDVNYLFKKMAKLDIEHCKIESKLPNTYALAQKYGTLISPSTILRTCDVSLDDCVNCLSDHCQEYDYSLCIISINELKKGIQKRGEKVVKKYLRRQGKSFVTKNGVNPCLAYLQELNTALNAPRFNGLNEWLEKMGLSVRLDTSRLLSEEDATKLKNAILDADKDMTVADKWMLQLCLGIDGYNAFVKEFNGD